jgi:hypothetical protein
MKTDILFLLAPILGVAGKNPLRAHKFNPRAQGVDKPYDRYAGVRDVRAQAAAINFNLGPIVDAPYNSAKFAAHDANPVEAHHLEARYTIEPGEDGSTQRVNNLPSGWAYQDCYADTNGPTLYSFTEDNIAYSTDSYSQGDNTQPNGVSATNCINYCGAKGYPYAGLEYHYQCYCGYRIRPGNSPSTGCTLKCYGINPQNETCGGSNRMQIYSQPAGPTYPPRVPTNLPSNYAYVNCYNTGTGTGQVIQGGSSTTNTNNTGAACAAYCNNLGFAFAGTMNQQCSCGSSLLSTATTSTCVQQCPGDKTEACGGTQKMSVYQRQAAVSGFRICGHVCVLCLLLDWLNGRPCLFRGVVLTQVHERLWSAILPLICHLAMQDTNNRFFDERLCLQRGQRMINDMNFEKIQASRVREHWLPYKR